MTSSLPNFQLPKMNILSLAFGLFFIVWILPHTGYSQQTKEQTYFEWTKLPFPKEENKQRRVAMITGMVFTVEPWYYNHDKNISVFTEDEVHVTANGVEVLTKDLPRTAEGLEELMKSK